jgi:hypothetical protein
MKRNNAAGIAWLLICAMLFGNSSCPAAAAAEGAAQTDQAIAAVETATGAVETATGAVDTASGSSSDDTQTEEGVIPQDYNYNQILEGISVYTKDLVYDDDDNLLYVLMRPGDGGYSDYSYDIWFDIVQAQKMVDSGTLAQAVDQIHTESGSDNTVIYLHIYAYERGFVIPHECFNLANYVTAIVEIKDSESGYNNEKYGWDIYGASNTQRDFSPYVYAVKDRTTESYFEEGTSFLTLHSDYVAAEYGDSGFWCDKFLMDGDSVDMAQKFPEFFSQYCVDDIKTTLFDNYYVYSYGDYPDYTQNLGYFCLSSYDEERGGLVGAVKSDYWDYYNGSVCADVYGVESHGWINIPMMIYAKTGDFVISDALPLGSDESKVVIAERTGGSNFTNANPEENYSKDDLKNYFTEEGITAGDTLDADTAASADFMEIAKDMECDVKVTMDDVAFEIAAQDIEENVAFEPNIDRDLTDSKVDAELLDEGYGEQSTEIIEFTNAFSETAGVLPGDVEITFPVDTEKNQPGDTVTVLYYNKSSGALEEVQDAIVSDDYCIEFELEHFSEYALVNRDQKSEEPVGDSESAPNTSSGTTTSGGTTSGGSEVTPNAPSGGTTSGGSEVTPNAPSGGTTSGGSEVTPNTPSGDTTSGGSEVTPNTPSGGTTSGGSETIPNTSSGDTSSVNPVVSPDTTSAGSTAVTPSAAPVTGSSSEVTSAGTDTKEQQYETAAGIFSVTDAANATVAYQPVSNLGSATKVTIPDTVELTINGETVTYKVTSIAEGAFQNNKKLKAVTIGKNITKIGKKAFYNCKNLKTIQIKTKKLTAKNIGANAFQGIPNSKKVIVKVPAASYKKYKKLFSAKGLGKKVTYKRY